MKQNSERTNQGRIGFQYKNKALGLIYKEWYLAIKKQMSSQKGLNIELGSGPGFIKEVIPEMITSDILLNSNVDMNLNALDIGIRYENKVSNLILINVFHHINDIESFLYSATNALVHKGRIILIEPSNNIWSRLIYTLSPHEPYLTSQKNWRFTSLDPLFDSNQALSWIVFNRDLCFFKQLFPEYYFIKYESLMPFSYILTGGHSLNTSINNQLINCIRKLERPFLDKNFGLFDLICIEKT